MTTISLDEKISRFGRIYTGAITDILDEMGHTHTALPSSLQPLVPGQRITGIAYPMFGRPSTQNDPDIVFPPLLNMLGDIKPGHVIVSQANDDICAHLGELSAETAKYRGCRGAIIYGGIRDTDYMMNIDFPAFSLYKTPLDVIGRWELVEYDVPITIAGTPVNPGDFIVADRDGVVVIPAAITDAVLLKAEEVVSTENLVRNAILEGVHPLDAYKQYGRF